MEILRCYLYLKHDVVYVLRLMLWTSHFHEMNGIYEYEIT